MSNRTLHRKIDTRNRFCRTSSLVRRSGMRGLGSARHEVPGSRRLHAGGPSTNRSKMTARARQVLVASLVDGAAPHVHSLPADTAVLLERGFSAEIRPDGREPVSYDYDRVSPQSPWKVLLGAYIREWAMCARLVERSDDMFVIAKPGDEVALPFPAQPPAAGLQRTYLLQAD